jgi:eukaryotic-like serine/threonine-protein kinase
MNRESSEKHEERLNEVLLAYVERIQAGQQVDRRAVLAAHPDLQEELEDFFAGNDEVARLAAPWRTVLETGAKAGSTTAPPGPELGQLGDFRLLREIGRGGMGIVYEAEQISLRRRVALKILSFAAAIDPRQLQRFQNEALAAAHLQHEHIVPVHFVGCERSVNYYAMQFIDGRSLAELITELRQNAGEPVDDNAPADTTGWPAVGRSARRTAPPTAVASLTECPQSTPASIAREQAGSTRWYFNWVAELGIQAALALEHAHQAGVTHRDIKPANLLLDGRGQLWITDFGLAQFSTNTGLTLTGEVLGTLRYASPEQALAKRGVVDHRSDIYSLGATLYELLSLRPLFDGRDRLELLRQIGEEEPRSLRSSDRAIPEDLETIILKAIAKEPGDRYASAQALADDLRRFREDLPIQARRPTVVEKSARWARRHRPIVASALAALLLTTAGLGVAVVLTARAYEQERLRAQEVEERFRLARRLADDMIQIADQEATGDPRDQLLRRRLLEAAVVYYQEFIELRRENPEAQAELAATQGGVKTLLADLAVMRSAFRHMLLSDPAVQRDLKLSAEQRQRLGVVIRDIREHEPVPGDEVPHISPEEKSQQLVREMKAHEAAIATILQPDQLHRLGQIALQDRGVRAFQEPEVIVALMLSREQRDELRGIMSRGRGGRRGGPGGDPGPPPPFDRGPPGDRKGGGRRGLPPRPEEEGDFQQMQRAIDVLTAEQRASWRELTGPPFKGREGGPRGPGRP